MPMENIINHCYAFLLFCRAHFYKVTVALVVTFLVMQYAVNILVQHYNFQKMVTPGLSWISSLSIQRMLKETNRVDEVSSNISTVANLTLRTSTLAPMGLSTLKHTSRTTYNNTTSPPQMFSVDSSNINKSCPLVPPKLVGPLKVMLESPSFDELEKMFPDLEPGGRFHPKTCKARHKVAIIIPYRDREEHLRIFLHNLHPILHRQQIDYGIYVIEEAGKTKFNRALLMNIGFVESLKQYSYDCFIFHDVDLIPEDDRNLYTCPEQPRHMSVAIDVMDYKLPYRDIFGGVSALGKKHMEMVNGFSNEFWGWGGEDDDMANRIKYHGLQISRYSASIARYKMLRHKKDVPNPDRYQKLYKGRLRFKKDGLKNLHYKVLDIVLKKLYTWVLVDVKPIK